MKPSNERSAFENMALGHLEQTFTTFASEMGAILGQSEVEIRSTEEAVAAGEANVQEKTAKLEASTCAIAEAEANSKTCETSLRDIEEKIKNLDGLRTAAETDVSKIMDELRTFSTVEEALKDLQTPRMIVGTKLSENA